MTPSDDQGLPTSVQSGAWRFLRANVNGLSLFALLAINELFGVKEHDQFITFGLFLAFAFLRLERNVQKASKALRKLARNSNTSLAEDQTSGLN
jgi:hypothetical protein